MALPKKSSAVLLLDFLAVWFCLCGRVGGSTMFMYGRSVDTNAEYRVVMRGSVTLALLALIGQQILCSKGAERPTAFGCLD